MIAGSMVIEAVGAMCCYLTVQLIGQNTYIILISVYWTLIQRKSNIEFYILIVWFISSF